MIIQYLQGRGNQDTTSDDAQSSLTIYDASINEIKRSIDHGCRLWPELFEALMKDLADKVSLRLSSTDEDPKAD